jgi:hypothetical protein
MDDRPLADDDPATAGATAVGQLVAVVLLATTLLTVASGALVAVALSGHGEAVLLVLPVLAVLLLRVIAGATPAAMPLGRTGGGRWLWALLVAVGGTVVLATGWSVLDHVTHPGGALLALAGVPYALVAGLLLSGRRPRVTAAAILVALAVAGSVALRNTGPDEVELRLTAAGIDRTALRVVEVPGYRPAGDAYGKRLGSRAFVPVDLSTIPPYRYADVAVLSRPPCQDVATGPSGRLDYTSCTAEADGLFYRQGSGIHGFEVRRGALTVVVSGPLEVDREVLRTGARTARPTTAADRAALHRPDEKDLWTADLPGFRLDPILADGVHFEPVGRGGGADSMVIMLGTGGPDFCARVRCETEAGGLTYRPSTISRAPEDYQGYQLRQGPATIQVTGGANVDRARLRAAVLAARPPTDREIVRALPAVQRRDPVARWRSWLKAHTVS